jgi:hypothetical protein
MGKRADDIIMKGESQEQQLTICFQSSGYILYQNKGAVDVGRLMNYVIT